MAVDMFIEIEGIKGETSDKGHKETIEVHSFSWGCSQTGSMSSGTGGGAGKASFSDLSIMCNNQKSSPLLFYHCASGKHVAKATLFVRKAGETQQDYYKVHLTDLLVSSFQSSASGGSDAVTESFSLNFAKIKFEYAPQDAKGVVGTFIPAGWDLKENVKV